MPKPILLSWSGGKDSAMALHTLQQSDEYEVRALLTTLTDDYDRISMHGVRRELLLAQSRELGASLHEIRIPKTCTNEVYEREMKAAMLKFRDEGVDTVAFGDLFLEDLRKYREDNLAKVGMKGLFPVWTRDTRTFSRRFIELGFKAILVTVDPKVLDAGFVGRTYDESLLDDLPESVDPCGENGEFHSFVYDGPNFASEIPLILGEKVEREGFWFCDLRPRVKTS
ncbi:MAG: diphthine--ammonia ligase [Planctomycetes bacterium]|nr:diphthine--ammonia ligase [Planctomycetota bacterium]